MNADPDFVPAGSSESSPEEAEGEDEVDKDEDEDEETLGVAIGPVEGRRVVDVPIETCRFATHTVYESEWFPTAISFFEDLEFEDDDIRWLALPFEDALLNNG